MQCRMAIELFGRKAVDHEPDRSLGDNHTKEKE